MAEENDGWKDVGFEKHDEYGFYSDYIRINHKDKTIHPMWDADELKESFATKATKVTYLGKNGYDMQREFIESKGVKEGDVLTVKTCSVGDWSSTYTFEEIDGDHNTVMFDYGRA